MPDLKPKKVGTMSINPTQTSVPETTASSQMPRPIGKMTVKPFSETIENGSPELIPVSATENFVNRFGIMKDQIELSMYEGFKAKAHDTEGMISDMWKGFLDNRIKTQEEDIAYQAKHIDWNKEDAKPFMASDIINRPAHFFSNQLPELLGQSIGSMTEPIMAGAVAGGAVASIVGPEGTVLGMTAGTMGGFAAGLVGLGTGRFLESMSEAGNAYKDAVKYLKKGNPTMSDDEIHGKALEVLDHVFSRNMALGLADIPEIALAFVPGSKIFSKFGSKAFRTGVTGIKLAGVPLIEATEEGLQYYISESGQNKVRKAGDQKDLSLSAMWNTEEFQTSIQSGMVLGGLLGGAGKVSEKVFASKRMLDTLPEADRIKQVSQLQDDYIFKRAQEGKVNQLKGFLHDQGELSDGLFSDATIKDEVMRIKQSKQDAREAVKGVEEKAEIHNAVVANKNIVHPEMIAQAYRNQIEINKVDKAVEALGSAKELNKGEIQKLELTRKHLSDINGLIGQGHEVEKDKVVFTELLDKHKEELRKIKEKEVKKEKPIVTKEPVEKIAAKVSAVSAEVSGKAETFDNITKNYKKNHPVKVMGEMGEGLTDAKFVNVSSGLGKVVVTGTRDGGTHTFSVVPEEVRFMQKEKKVKIPTVEKTPVLEKVVYPLLHIQDKNLAKIHTGEKTATSRTRKVSDIKPGLHQLKDSTIVDVKAAKEVANIKDLKDPEKWARAEGFDSLEDLKQNAKPDLKAFATGVNNEPLWIHAFEKVEPSTEQKIEKEKAVIDNAKPKFKSGDDKKGIHEDRIAALKEFQKQFKSDGQANDIATVAMNTLISSAIDVAILGLNAHQNVQRAIKEAMEWLKSSPEFKKMTRKEREKSKSTVQGGLQKALEELDRLRSIENSNEENANDEDFDSSEDEYEQIAREAGLQYEDNEGRVKAFINPLRGLYKDVENLPEREAFDMLYEFFHKDVYNERDVRTAIQDLENKDLVKALEDATNLELVQLSNAFKNIKRLPFIHHLNMGKREMKTYVSNTAKDVIFETIRSVEERLSNVAEVQKQLTNYQNKLAKLTADPQKAYANKKTREEIYNLELETLSKITGEDWTLFADNPKHLPENTTEKSYKDYYINNPTYLWKGKSASLQKSVLRSFLLKSFDAKEIIDGLKNKNDKGFKSNVSQLADLKGRNTKGGKLGNYFDNIMNKRKSGYALRSHILDAADEIHTVEKTYLKGNVFVDYFKKLNTAAKILVYDGMKNESTGKKEETGSLSEQDLMMAILLNFITPSDQVGKNEWAMPVEQFSDKKQTYFGQTPKYSVAEAAKLLKDIPVKDMPFKEEFQESIDSIKKFLDKNKTLFGDINTEEQARLFVYNYAVNKYYSDLYYQGLPENYNKKGVFDYVGMVKRAGSALSSGLIGNLEIEGGIGQTSNHIVVNNNEQKVEINGVSYDVDIADGQTFHTKEWDERVKKSFGEQFHTILKPIYSTIDNFGNRILIKSNSILLSEEYVKDKPILKNLLKLMQDNEADYLTVESGVKHDVKNTATKIDWNTGKPTGKININIRENKNWRIQQDFNQPEKLDWKRLTKQMMRHFMDFKTWSTAQNLINDAVKIEKDKLDKIFEDPKLLKKFIIENLEDNDTNRHVLQLLNNGVSLDHPHLIKFIQTIASSAITKKMLDIKGNGGIYIEMSFVGTNLKQGECFVPKNSGLKINENIFSTRVPSSDLHSTSYSKVVGYLPEEMGNVIVMHPKDMKKAGADFDGDARHVWALSKKGDSLIDDVFRIAEAEYLNPDNQTRIDSPIDTDAIEEVLKDSDYKKKVGNKHLLSSLLYMYQNNKDAKKVVGIVATSSKIFSFLRAHQAKLKIPVSMPLLENGKIVDSIEMSEVKTDDLTKQTMANNINQAVDAAKLQNLLKMGMTEVGASIYCMLEQLGMSEKHTINFMAHPVVRKYLDAISEAKSVNSTINEYKAVDEVAKYYDNSALEEDGEGKTKFPRYPQDVKLTPENVGNPLKVLQKIKYLKSLSDDYFKFGSVVNLTEKSPKTFSDLYKAGNDLATITENGTHFELNTSDSPYITNAELSHKASKKFYRSNTIFGTKRAKVIIDVFEKMFDYKEYKGKDPAKTKSLNKERIKALSDAMGSMLMAEMFRNSKGKEEVRKSVNQQFRDFKEPNKFLELLMIDESIPEAKQKLQLKPEFQRDDLNTAEIGAIQVAFAALPEDFKQELILNTYYQHGFIVSRKIGGYSVFFDAATHKDLSEKLSEAKQTWNTDKNEIKDIKQVLKEIIRNNPSLVPDADLFSSKELSMQKGANQISMPWFVKKREGENYNILPKLQSADGAYHYDTASTFNFKTPAFTNIKTYTLPATTKLQQESGMPLVSEDSDLDQGIKNHFQKIYPNANVKFIDSIPGDKSALGAFIGNTFYINPKLATQDTYFHEFAHGYWATLPDNDSAKVGLLELFKTEEKAVQAIGEAGVGLAKIKLSDKVVVRFKGLLTSFWRKVKAAFGIQTKKDMAAAFAQRMWKNEDQVNLGTIHTDFIKYQLSQTAENMQSNVVTDLEKKLGKSLTKLTVADMDQLRGTNKKLEEEIAEMLPEGEVLEEILKSPKKLFHIIAGKSAKHLNINQYSIAQNLGNYSQLNKLQKTAVDQLYKVYQKDAKEVDGLWTYFPTVKDFNKNFSEIKRIFNKLSGMDSIARGVLYDTLMVKYAEDAIVRAVQREATEGFTGYKGATIAFNKMVYSSPQDFKYMISQWFTSDIDLQETHAELQWHTREMAEDMSKAQMDWTVVAKELKKLEEVIRKEGGDLKKLIQIKKIKNKKFVVFSAPNASMTPSERVYITLVKSTNEQHGRVGDVALMVPQITSNFFDLMKKFGIYAAIKQSLFGDSSYDGVSILHEDQVMTFKEAKTQINLSKSNGLINNFAAIKKLNALESQAEDIFKNRKIDEAGKYWDNENKNTLALGHKFEADQYASDNINGVMMQYFKDLIYRNQMEKHVPIAAYMQNIYKGNTTKFVRSWLESFYGHNLFKQTPNSILGKYAKYLNFVMSLTAWRYLALNPMGMVFNMSAGLSGSFRELGPVVMLRAMRRMASNPRKCIAIMKQQKVVNIDVDPELHQSEKYLKKIQAFAFAGITGAEYVNQGYSYIGLLEQDEWNSYDNKGNLIQGKDGITESRHVEITDTNQRINGAYGPLSRRPIGYTPEGRALMMFKNWLPDVVLAHLRLKGTDRHGSVRKGIVWTIADPAVWSKVFAGIKDKKAWDSLAEEDRQNIGKFSREILISGMLLMLILSLDDDDDENKTLIAGFRRSLGDVTYVFDLDNMEFLFDSPVPVLGTMIDIKKAFETALKGTTYSRNSNGHDKGDYKAVNDFTKLAPGHAILQQLDGE